MRERYKARHLVLLLAVSMVRERIISIISIDTIITILRNSSEFMACSSTSAIFCYFSKMPINLVSGIGGNPNDEHVLEICI